MPGCEIWPYCLILYMESDLFFDRRCEVKQKKASICDVNKTVYSISVFTHSF